MDLQIKTSHKFSSSNCIQREENYINMGETGNNNLKIITTNDKIYNLENTEEAIDFLIYVLNGKYYTSFIDFVFGHLGINFYKYLDSLKERDKNIFSVMNDVSPFFDMIVEDFESNNVFYRFIYSHQYGELIKKQKINNIIDGLKKTLDYNLDFHNASIFRNMYLEMDNDFYKLAYTREFSSAYIYYCVTYKLMSIYDYIHDKFYSFIEEKNKFDCFYSHKYKEWTC
jgi:phosphopantetheine adenylyltransferase